LQDELLNSGQHIPEFVLKEASDLVQTAKITVSSEYELSELSSDFSKSLDLSVAQLLPLIKGKVPKIIFHAESETDTELEVELRISSKTGNYTPDVSLDKQTLAVKSGKNCLNISFEAEIKDVAYAFVIFQKNPKLKLKVSNQRITGVLSVFNLVNKAVSNYGKQTPPKDIGMEEFEFWCPQRRPEGHNVAMRLEPAIKKFGKENLKTGVYRPTTAPNAWVATFEDENPQLKISWDKPEKISKVDLLFDTDFDHPMESVLMGHPEDVMPFCVRNYEIKDDKGKIIYAKKGNYQTKNTINFKEPIITNELTVVLEHPSENVPAALFSIRCYS
jgi:hypothetical protein